MTLPTGVQAVSENNYGRPNEAYLLLKKMLKSFSFALPGSIYEVSPDFGMFSQAWNMYAFGEPIIKQFFGIRPEAYQKTITVSPLLPTKLTYGKIEKVAIGNNEFSLSYSQNLNSDSYKLSQKLAIWKIVFTQSKGKYSKWVLNGKQVKPKIVADLEVVEFYGKVNELVLIK